MSYTPYYPNGWQSGQSGGTPITPEALQNMEDGIKASMRALESADYPGCYYRVVDGETEWFNPPMIVGVQYRTTERYNGKVVYTKLTDCGELTNAKTVALHSFTHTLRWNFIVAGTTSRHAPYINATLDNQYSFWAIVDGPTLKMTTNGYYDGRQCYAQAWYVQEADPYA